MHDAVSLATYAAESALAGFLVPDHARTGDAALALVREAFRMPAEALVIGDELHVRLESCAAPSTRAIAALCDGLTLTATRDPATGLRLVYSMGGRAAER